MKKRSTTKSFDKFKKRNTHKRRSNEKMKEALLRAVRECNVDASAVRIGISEDGGRRARVSTRRMHDEITDVGTFSSSKSGFGFVTVEGRERDIFVPAEKTLGAIDGDTVEVIYHEYKNYLGEEKTEGRVKEIVAKSRVYVVGTVDEEQLHYRRGGSAVKKLILIPDDPKLHSAFRIRVSEGARPGDKVECKIIRIAGRAEHECDVVSNFGPADTLGANYESILAECEIPVDFTKEELLEADFFASLPISDEGRVRRKEIIFTIDGEGAKDLDDAVSLRRIKGGYQLGVHIADVSYYIKERSHLDRAVMSRGTSVYFTDKVVPMLPRSLSNGACSLNAGEEKYTLSAIVNLDEKGEIRSCKIEPSVIVSRVRGVYSEVNKIFDGVADGATRAKYKEVVPTLERMRELYLILLQRTRERGYVELETREAEIVLDQSGKPTDILVRERGDAECLIEQFMLVANEAVAKMLSDADIPCVYRVHDVPPPEKLFDFLSYAHSLGFNTSLISHERQSPKDFAALLKAADERGILAQVSCAMLRAMSKARYSDERRSHFGLALTHYCHFTSPIRRLSDLATHRIIHKVLLEGKRAEAYTKYAKRAAAAATECELRAITAERRIENLYKVLFMKDRIGEEFDAVINSITSFGFFAELENTCEGLVPISELPGMFIFDEKNLTLRSRSRIYRIADRVRVRLVEADMARGKLRFDVVE